MSLPLPNLDDRTFEDLLEEAQQIAKTTQTQWTDFSPGDPGRVLLELYAYLTETMIYRLNRLPEKVYAALLNLLGVKLRPPCAANVTLQFTLDRPLAYNVTIPRGTRVASREGDASGLPVVFRTAQPVVIPAGQTRAEALAYHFEPVEGELLGISTGLPGATFKVAAPPILEAPTGLENALMVGVEARPHSARPEMPAREFNGKTYQFWRQADHFTDLPAYPYVYAADRMAGTITFPPCQGWENHVPPVAPPADQAAARALAEQRRAHIPPAGHEIRAWYWRGGGSAGNVAANSLATLLDPLPGVRLSVTNPAPASGGYDAESLEGALQRGPQELYNLPGGVITARDYERLALRSSPAVARARAQTQVELWKRARRGTVEVLLVPDLPQIKKEQRGRGQVTAQELRGHETPDALKDCRASLEAARPLGTTCLVNWVRYKTVQVRARLVIAREEHAAAVRERVLRRLHEHINPLPTASGPGWPFGKPLQASDVYNIARAEPGVRWVDSVRLVLNEAPEKNVLSLAADHFEPATWYAGSASSLFRSLNDGEGWEPAGYFENESIRLVRPHPQQAGMLAVLTRLQEGGHQLHISCDNGETWKPGLSPCFRDGSEMNDITGMVWSLGDSQALLFGTSRGLYKFDLQHAMETDQPFAFAKQPVYAVATARTTYGAAPQIWLAVATQAGVYLSHNGGQNFTRHNAGLQGNEDIQKLAFQVAPNGTYLWAGTAAAGGQEGLGCLRLPLEGELKKETPWERFGPKQGWRGGSCHQLAFSGSRVFAATHHQGVLSLDTSGTGRKGWEVPDVETCGLPPRSDPGPFQPVIALATNWNPGANADRLVILASVVRDLDRPDGEGVYRSLDSGRRYQFVSQKEFSERVTLPATWLFASGEHELVVAYEDQAG